ncbi:MAG: class I SAM-dependent methyltransferase [Actinomycetota bacterium]|nr:class I SAM-dependent methyltransferase [Actinomycetota bacterium]
MKLYDRYLSTQVQGLAEDTSRLTEDAVSHFKLNITPLLPADRSAEVVELGCGYGRNLLALRECGYQRVLGVDVSEEEVRYAKDVLGLEGVILADCFEFLTGLGRVVDAVLLIDFLEHLEEEESIRLLEGARTVLKIGGTLLIQAPNGAAPLSPWRYADITHKRAYTPQSLAQSLTLAGFGRNKLRFLPALAPGSGWRSRLRRAAWWGLINPGLRQFLRVAYGNDLGGIYSANLIAVATK